MLILNRLITAAAGLLCALALVGCATGGGQASRFDELGPAAARPGWQGSYQTTPAPKAFHGYCQRFFEVDPGCGVDRLDVRPDGVVAQLPCWTFKNSTDCSVEMTPARLYALRRIHRRANDTITYTSDVAAFGEEDFWTALPQGGRGDCDEYAITKMHALLREGWPRRAMRLTFAEIPGNEFHLVLTVRTTQGLMVLDNRYPEPMPVGKVNYWWVGQEIPGNGDWMVLGGSGSLM